MATATIPALGLADERGSKARAALARRDAKLIEIAGFGVDGGEAGGPAARVEPDNNSGACGAQRAQMTDEPSAAVFEVDAEASLAPRRDP